MTEKLIQVDGLSKLYRIRASVGLGWWRNRGILADDLMRFTNRLRGKPIREKIVNFWALKDVSFEAGPGDVIGIIGRNGAGKSTMLKILGRVTEPTSGRAVVMGRVGSLLEVGTGFHSELTGRENIFVSGAILGMSRAEVRKKFDEIVAFSGVDEFLETPVKRFSSGMEVRLAFSVAAHLNPNVLLVDEVLSVGDFSFREKSIRKIKEVAHNGGTIMFVSHNMTTLASLCNKAIVLEHGKITFPVGNVSSAIEHYLANVRDDAQKNIKAGRRGAEPVGIEITNFGVYDDTGDLLESLPGGDAINFLIEYEDRGLNSDVKFNFEILMKTLSGEVIAIMNSQLKMNDLSLGKGHGKVSCRIEKLPLSSGMISITVSALQNYQVLDKIVDVFVGRVATGGHQEGIMQADNDAWITMDHNWRFENDIE